MIGVTVTLWQSCQPAAAPLYAYQCSAVQTADLSWHRGSPGWATGSDIRSASGISVPALPWQLPASHTATASPWLPPHLDTTPGNWNRRRETETNGVVNDAGLFQWLLFRYKERKPFWKWITEKTDKDISSQSFCKVISMPFNAKPVGFTLHTHCPAVLALFTVIFSCDAGLIDYLSPIALPSKSTKLYASLNVERCRGS